MCVGGKQYLFLCKAGAQANDIHNVTLYDTNVGKMPPTKSIQFLAFAFLTLLLLGLSLDAEAHIQK